MSFGDWTDNKGITKRTYIEILIDRPDFALKIGDRGTKREHYYFNDYISANFVDPENGAVCFVTLSPDEFKVVPGI